MEFISEFQDLPVVDSQGLGRGGGGGGGARQQQDQQQQLALPSKNLFFDGEQLSVWKGR
jgi:hypothetical protein